MTDKERLEFVKNNVTPVISELGIKYAYEITELDFDWLIEQAERAQELETKLENVTDKHTYLEGEYYSSQKQNKQYRQVIESLRSEIKYTLYSNKSEDVKRHYLQNAEREADEAMEG